MLKYKAKRVGIRVVRVSERYSSQTCASCQARRKSNRVRRGLYRCHACPRLAHDPFVIWDNRGGIRLREGRRLATVFIALGSNLGDRAGHLRGALRGLSAAVEIERVSRFYETAPVGVVDQPPFLNAVARGRTDLQPYPLLAFLHRLEAESGRVRTLRWGPRTLDLDLLLYEDLVLDSPELTLPHPRMAERSFVLVPLLEIWPEARLPDGTELRPIAATLPDRTTVAPWREG